MEIRQSWYTPDRDTNPGLGILGFPNYDYFQKARIMGINKKMSLYSEVCLCFLRIWKDWIQIVWLGSFALGILALNSHKLGPFLLQNWRNTVRFVDHFHQRSFNTHFTAHIFLTDWDQGFVKNTRKKQAFFLSLFGATAKHIHNMMMFPLFSQLG